METPEPYTLVSTLGLAPAVVTELIWSYARDPERPRVPERVILITTQHGREAWQEKAMDSGMWESFCNDILGGVYIEPEFPNESDDKNPIIDVHNNEDDLVVANVIYDEVYDVTRPGSGPVVGSLAGGRKTMSAHMMAAFTIFARRSDELVHVLASQELEQDDNFYYPPPEAALDDYPIYRVNMPFAPLHAYLVRDFFGTMPPNDRDLNAMMNAIRDFEFSPPAKAVIYIATGAWQSSTVQLCDEAGEVLDTFKLSRKNLCTLLVMAYHLDRNHPLGVSNLDLMHNNVQDQNRAVNQLFGRPPSPWTAPEDLTKALNRLKDQLKRNASARQNLSIEGTRNKEETRYTWSNEEGLPIELRGTAEILHRAKTARWNHLFPGWTIKEIKKHNPLNDRPS